MKGGSANDYDYVGGDPVNNFDLSGTRRRHGGCAHELICPSKAVQDLFNDAFGSLTWMGHVPGLKSVDGNLRRRFLSKPSYIATNTRTALRLIYLENATYRRLGSFNDVMDLGVMQSDPSFVWWALTAAGFITADLKNANPLIWSLLRGGASGYQGGS